MDWKTLKQGDRVYLKAISKWGNSGYVEVTKVGRKYIYTSKVSDKEAVYDPRWNVKFCEGKDVDRRYSLWASEEECQQATDLNQMQLKLCRHIYSEGLKHLSMEQLQQVASIIGFEWE